jgi:hypothetical protein
MATVANLSIDQGAEFYRTMTVVDNNGLVVDLSTYTAAGQLRKSYTANEFIPLTVVVLNASLGKISIGLSNLVTDTLTINRYVYDVEITSDSLKKYRILEGNITVSPNVTK